MGLMAEGYDGLQLPAQGKALFDLGLARLKQLGVSATGELLRGDATPLIVDCVRRLKVDLVVLGHRRQSFLNRWWSGGSGGYLVDGISCSLLVARATISDEEFERRLAGHAK